MTAPEREETPDISQSAEPHRQEEPALQAEPEASIPPRERILPLRSYCSHVGGSGCTRCAAVCPHGAVSVSAEDGPRIDADACTRCGLCMGVCDAFASLRITLADLYERCLRHAQEGGPVVFTCNDHVFPGLDPHPNVIVLPCLASVPPEFWTALLAQGITVGIHCDRTYCETCTVAGPQAPALFRHALKTAQSWSGREITIAEEIPERGTVLEMYTESEELDRRGIFARAAREGMDIASGAHRRRNSGTVNGFHEQRERMRAEGRVRTSTGPSLAAHTSGVNPPLMWPRQELLTKALQANPLRAPKIERYVAVTDEALCEGSGICADVCPTHARQKDPETGAVTFDQRYCIACGCCIANCPAGACDFEQTTALSLIEHLLAESEEPHA